MATFSVSQTGNRPVIQQVGQAMGTYSINHSVIAKADVVLQQENAEWPRFAAGSIN